ncbi:hypothetical protein K439DRAFT_1623689 [Ramaria rubella]|nr:hypothetical protein K439DRAFT_1623689 [Ramaria rubella]
MYLSTWSLNGNENKAQKSHLITQEFFDCFQLYPTLLDDGTTIDPLAGAEIKHQPATIGTLREKIVHWFCNHTKSTKSPAASVMPALVTFPGPPKKATDISLFSEAHKAQIIDAVNTRHSALRLSTQHNFTQWILAQESPWNELTVEQQQEWQQHTDAHNASLETPPCLSESHIYACVGLTLTLADKCGQLIMFI